ncbi:hypothetical protein QT969_10460 [Rhodococcus sp. CSLK01-03]|uniref:Uncharacterized protein n=1 Tax=Rhodococcus indonesiensis TaxID=3055869 RepID=A0ABT7RM62_9NOCA|nr:hypothetical protein [Rhodococcus indonesiensis]MDM7488713.1 hypothetical protein [Rhodococcus indonesiensis]
MAQQLRVIHGTGEDDIFPGSPAFSVEEGVLLVFADRARNVVSKAYNREVWASAEYEDAP